MALTRRRVQGLKHAVGYHDLLADLRKPGCPACHGSNRAAWYYLDSLLWEFVNDSTVRLRLRANRGFCREHALMAISVASQQAAASGMAILYEDFLRYVVKDATRAAGARTAKLRRRRPKAKPTPRTGCTVCRSATFVAENYLRILAQAEEGSEPGRAIRCHGRGLCLPHLLQGFELARDPVEVERLLEVFNRAQAELQGELREFIRKQDYRFRDEGFTEGEANAWVRAVCRLVGEPRATRPPER